MVVLEAVVSDNTRGSFFQLLIEECRDGLPLGLIVKDQPSSLRFALGLIKQDPSRKIGVKAIRQGVGWSSQYLLLVSGLP